MARILLVDDDGGARQMAAYNLRKAGHEVDQASDGQEGLARFVPRAYDLVMTDVRMPGRSGIDLARAVRERDADVPVLVTTAFGSIEIAVQAMKAGAYDFVLKPFGRDQLLVTVERALAHRRLAEENSALRRQLAGIERPIVYRSAAMQQTIELCDRLATSNAPVLITGESGTGKELVARRMHARGSRAARPFVAVNCAAIPLELAESELFGHRKGAFTGATAERQGRFVLADGGTIFLDEVGELPLAAQSKLLRVLQEGTVDVLGGDKPAQVDVRVLAATNRDLHAAIAGKTFREDLFFRLNVFEVAVPPLRERTEDIEPLVEHFVAELGEGRALTLPLEVLANLRTRRWPGNVRELRSACERMVLLCPGDTLSTDVLPPNDDATGQRTTPPDVGEWPTLPPEGLSLLDLEKGVIERVLVLKQGNVSETARYLRIPRHVLLYRIEKYGIVRPPR
ncbi:MAG: sigma-54 dependent transcriptional regulator [Myxococcota bacterium]